MAHVVPKLFKAIIVFSDRAPLYSDVISLTADQLKTVSHVQRAAGNVVHKHFPSNHPKERMDSSIYLSK